MQDAWWARRATKIQCYADTYNMDTFYNAVKSVYGPQKRNITLPL